MTEVMGVAPVFEFLELGGIVVHRDTTLQALVDERPDIYGRAGCGHDLRLLKLP